MDVERWLDGLGLGQYAQAFAENKIASDILPGLTSDDLREMGVAAIGDRRRLLAAIDALAGSDAATAPSPSDAERRQLTVMFVDLVGSTALSTRLDPEDYREMIRAYQDACAGVIARYDGYVAKFMGDGVLAYFGWPRGHENDAERAIDAGLGVVDAVSALAPPDGIAESLAVRIGIATGPVVVGDIVGEGAAQEAAVTGETPNLAARLQGLAKPDAVVIAATTHALTGGLFAYEGLGPQSLKGIAGATEAWRVTGQRRVESRFAAAHATELTPLVGRDEELEILRRRWQRAKAGEGQVVLLSGEPGIGKSRLVHALVESIADQSPHIARLQCSPHHANSALYPFAVQMEGALGFGASDDTDTKLDKLSNWAVEADQAPERIIPLIAPYLGIEAIGRYPQVEIAPQRRKELLFEALAERQLRFAIKQPTVAIVEDAHWIDPTSLELLGMHVELAPEAPIMIVITHRPEFVAPWVGAPHVTSLSLSRLEARQCVAMAELLSGQDVLPAPVLDRLVERTDGVPLFVEEMTRSVLAAGAATGGFELESLAVPATLQDALEARIDRSPTTREVAQVGAAIGREFDEILLGDVSMLGETERTEALDQLVETGLLFRRGVTPDNTYMFKHALIQNTAYDSMVRSTRQDIHKRIAGSLIKLRSDIEQTAPELLAHHYTQAGLVDQAVGYWLRAGERAHGRSANEEAIAHLNNGLQLIATLPESPDRRQRELTLQVTLGVPLQAIKGPGSPEVEEAYDRARALCGTGDHAPELLPVLWGLWRTQIARANIFAAIDIADEIHRVAQLKEDSSLVLQGHHAQWATLFDHGEYSAALEHVDRGIAIYDRSKHHGQALLFGGHDVCVCAQGHAALLLWTIGYPDQGLERALYGLNLADDLVHPVTLAHSLRYTCKSYLYRREPREVAEQADRLVALATEHNMVDSLALGTFMQGWAMAQSGRYDAGIAQMREGLVAGRAAGRHEDESNLIAGLAEALGKIGAGEEGLQIVDNALAVGFKRGMAYWDAELLRLKGDLVLSLAADNRTEAENYYSQAQEAARRRDAKSLELRTAMSLAGLWADGGRRAEAHDLLAPVYGWFTEGFDTRDLRDAKALRDALA